MTAKVAKVENYSAETTAKVLELYEAGKGLTVEAIAVAVGKSARSVIAKLSREGVYVAKTSKTAKARVTKAELVKRVAVALGVTGLETLEKASHEDLEALSNAVEAMQDELVTMKRDAQAEYEALE